MKQDRLKFTFRTTDTSNTSFHSLCPRPFRSGTVADAGGAQEVCCEVSIK
ncbi:hypothetical protein FTUN_5985 [Frigoriglobus tundricola]|uniref:Uncharacterized protein n=1 Tax=Frigoriglobus tundricola TaxID=2774151 RepID=A0A6M5YWI8_9BACT|nr:hypothetical protein FTUN_5985 [Frigoriglobus tundricola]